MDFLESLTKLTFNSDMIAPLLIGVIAIWYMFWVKPEREELNKYKDTLNQKISSVPEKKDIEDIVAKCLEDQNKELKDIFHKELLEGLKKSKEMQGEHNHLLQALIDKLVDKGVIDKIDADHHDLDRHTIDRLLDLVDRLDP